VKAVGEVVVRIVVTLLNSMAQVKAPGTRVGHESRTIAYIIIVDGILRV